MRLLNDEELSSIIDSVDSSLQSKMANTVLLYRIAWKVRDTQAELTRKEIVELIEAHMGIESLPYRDGATKIITLPYDVFEALKGS